MEDEVQAMPIEEPDKKESPLTALVEKWFSDHFCNPIMSGNPIYQKIYEAKNDLLARLEA